jgi:hypothetical protein
MVNDAFLAVDGPVEAEPDVVVCTVHAAVAAISSATQVAVVRALRLFLVTFTVLIPSGLACG